MSQATIYTITQTPITAGGTVTSFLPVTTIFPSVSGCSDAIYFDTSAVALDPYYGESINAILTCHPQAVTLWEQQEPGYNTITDLGPLNCPALYTTASTSIVNALTTYVACCPIDYTYSSISSYTGGVVGCNSPLQVGQALPMMVAYTLNSTTLYSETSGSSIYNSTITLQTGLTFYPAITTITAVGSSVYGFQIDGYVFAPTTTSGSILATATSPSTTGAATSTTTTGTTPGTNNSHSSGLGTGAKIGIGVGVSLGALGFLSLLLALFLIRRNQRKWQENRPPMEYSSYTPELGNTERVTRNPVSSPRSSTRSSAPPQVMSPQPSETIWEENVPAGYDPSKDGVLPQDGAHEIHA